MTQLKFYSHPEKSSLSAVIKSIQDYQGSPALILDQTLFFPQTNVHPSDSGTVIGPKGTFKVSSAVFSHGQLLHLGRLSGELHPDDEVDLKLDWTHRHQNLRLNTAILLLEHSLAHFFPELKWLPDSSSIHSGLYLTYQGVIDETALDALQRHLDQLIQSNEPITVQTSDTQALNRLGLTPHQLLPDKPRLVQIGNFSPVVSSGIYLDSTGLVGSVILDEITYADSTSSLHFHLDAHLPVASKLTPKPTPSSLEIPANLKQVIQAINQLRSQFNTDLPIQKPEELQTLYLGKSGHINRLTTLIPQLPPSDRSAAGKQINLLKQHFETKLRSSKPASSETWLDVTRPGKPRAIGHLHPVSLAIDEITRIFERIGFTRVRHPEVDWDWYAFEALNMPPDHPARDEWETFFVDVPKTKMGQMVLSPHTSNGQVREMQRLQSPPIRMINIARSYRRQSDVTHVPMLHQFEGLVVDKGINIQHLKGTIDYFAHAFFGPNAKSRIRPFHFQFTEPSFEVDFSCTICSGKGCRFCKSGWHEVGGAGMVHPNVLKAGGIDPEIYTGFAFGWGVERSYSLKPGLKLDDIRHLYTNRLEFLRQF